MFTQQNKEKGRCRRDEEGEDTTFCLFIRAIKLCITIQGKIYNQVAVIPKKMSHPQLYLSSNSHLPHMQYQLVFSFYRRLCYEEARIQLLPVPATRLLSYGEDTRRSSSRFLIQKGKNSLYHGQVMTRSRCLPSPIPTPNRRPPLPAQRTACVVVAIERLKMVAITNAVTSTLQAVSFILSTKVREHLRIDCTMSDHWKMIRRTGSDMLPDN